MPRSGDWIDLEPLVGGTMGSARKSSLSIRPLTGKLQVLRSWNFQEIRTPETQMGDPIGFLVFCGVQAWNRAVGRWKASYSVVRSSGAQAWKLLGTSGSF